MTTSDFSQVYFYNRMKEKYTELSGFVPDDASDICLRFGVLAGELETLCEKITALEGQYSPIESVGEVLERFAMMRGLARKPASFATGSLRLSRSAGDGTTVQVPSGVICKTPSGIRYKTTQSGTISPLGNNVVVSAVALEPGSAGNALAETITILEDSVPGITAVTNPQPFSGGEDLEGDDSLRRRLKASYAFPSNGVNTAFYEQAALSCSGVSCARAKATEGAPGAVTVYVSADKQESVGEAVLSTVGEKLSSLREPAVTVTAASAQAVCPDIAISVTMAPLYSGSQASAAAIGRLTQTIQSYIECLDIGSSLTLAKLGKLVMDAGCFENYTITAPEQDVVPEPLQVLRPGDIVITKAVV